jgi:carbamoyl-phosphate synthase large subunit
MEEALARWTSIGLPRSSGRRFTMGGTGGGIAYNREEFVTIVTGGLDASPPPKC